VGYVDDYIGDEDRDTVVKSESRDVNESIAEVPTVQYNSVNLH